MKDDKSLDKLDPGKREFLKRIAVTTAFATPVVQSFSMKGIPTAEAQDPPPCSPQGDQNQNQYGNKP